jgi:hypothetical protein
MHIEELITFLDQVCRYRYPVGARHIPMAN